MNKLLKLIMDNAGRQKQPINLAKEDGEAALHIYDVIDADWGVSALSVIDTIKQSTDAKVLNVYINSPGGSVFEARAIMAALQRFEGKSVAHIDSLCASAATSIALACDEVVMTSGALFMVHNASGLVWGDKNDMRETADLLEKIEAAIVDDYVNKTGKERDEIVAMMNAETWMTADEALSHGFIDRVIPSPSDKKAKNSWDLSAFNNAPVVVEPVAIEPEIIEPSATTANANRLQLIQAV